MNEFITLKPQDAQLPGDIRFIITKRAFSDLLERGEDPTDKLISFSQKKLLLVAPREETDIYEIISEENVFLCKISDDDNAMKVTGCYPINLRAQNNAMKNGICFSVPGGIIIQITLTSPYDLYFDIKNGEIYQNNELQAIDSSPSLKTIADKMREVALKNAKQDIDEEYQPEKKLLDLLQKAESYSILSSELEEQTANLIGKISYTQISSVEYDRIDRVVYEFEVRELDENILKTGVQVEVEDKKQNIHSAEIIEVVKADLDAPATALKLLFTEHIDISEFNQSGWFSLSFSTVNKDVQLTANEKIKTGEASAKYMDDIFGRGISAGFDDCDVDEIREKLLKKQYPPNESQMKAITCGINARDVFLVMGPPGTGKTTVILEWVKYFVKQGQRVLVSSQNNKAVDNVLTRIADEKNIDIIRIGSESKVQSEVIPFMFENKITALRNNISNNSEKRLRDIDDIQSAWECRYKRVVDAEKEINHVKNSREQFKNIIQRNLLPLYYDLSAWYEKYIENQRRKRKTCLCIKKLKRKIEKYENNTNTIIKLLTTVSYRINLRKIQKKVKVYEFLKIKEITMVAIYNPLRHKYACEFERVRNSDFMNLYMDLKKKDDAVNLANIIPEKKEINIWGLFDECRNIYIEDEVSCVYLKNKIENDWIVANNLINGIYHWKKEIINQQNYALNEMVLESVDLVGATCIGINSQKRFANLGFDVSIIDEAGQIQVHNALVPMSVSNKLIMLGDHKQIPPSVDQALIDLCEENGVKTDLLSMSLFEKMYYDLPDANKIMLDTQYRMPAEIADTISDWFYNGKYYSPEFKRNQKSPIPKLSSKPYVIIDTSKEANRYERKIEGAGCDNALEAEIITSIISMLSEYQENDWKEIGVISAYKSQVKLIRNNLKTIIPDGLVNEMVATLDSFQGQERNIILYSFTKSSKESPRKKRIGFLNELRRLNVAMTRCKKMLVLIGDMNFLGGCQYCDRDGDGIPIYDKSEKQFADFIKKMVEDVKNGHGELITYDELKKRMG